MSNKSENDWKSQHFRELIVTKISEQIKQSTSLDIKFDATHMERQMYQKATSRETYLAYISKLLHYIKEKNENPQPKSESVSSSTEKKNDQKQATKNSAPAEWDIFNNRNVVNIIHKQNNNDNNDGPSSSQKLLINKTAIASVIHNPNWVNESESVKHELRLFGNYIAVKLNRIEDPQELVSVQMKILSLINKV